MVLEELHREVIDQASVIVVRGISLEYNRLLHLGGLELDNLVPQTLCRVRSYQKIVPECCQRVVWQGIRAGV